LELEIAMKKELLTKSLAIVLSITLCITTIIFVNPKKEVKGDNELNNYAKALQEALYFFDGNMCGTDVDENCAYSWRSDCHTGDTLVNYKGKTVDVSGGYHDAGDHAKFGLPQSYSATMLGISYLEYKNVYEKYGLTKHYKTIMKHFIDYFERCTILDSNGDVESFCYQVGSGKTDHAYWGKPEEQDSKQGGRTNQAYFTSSSNTATDIVSETAAALAIYYLNFNDETALSYAKKLYAYAMNNTKMVAVDGPIENGEEFYKSSRFADDYCMASVMLYKATGDNTYANQFKSYCSKGDGTANCNEWAWLSWDDVSGLALSYGSKEGLYGNPYGDPLKNCFDNMKNGSTVTNGYYCLLQWGSARYNSNMDAMAFMLKDEANAKWALSQLDIILGDDNRSFVVGHTGYTLYPHHRAASGYTDVNANGTTPMAHTLVGALVGGYDKSGNFVNNASNYQYTEVALDYNAGFVLALAGACNYAISIYSDSQKTVDDTTLSNELRMSVVSKYRDESAAARGENESESVPEKTTEVDSESVPEITTEEYTVPEMTSEEYPTEEEPTTLEEYPTEEPTTLEEVITEKDTLESEVQTEGDSQAESKNQADDKSKNDGTKTDDKSKDLNKKTCKAGTKVSDKKYIYKVTKVGGKSGSAGEVKVTGLKKKSLTTIKIATKVSFYGITYKVTAIDNKAFKKNNKIKKVYIGKNVKSIGAGAFFGTKKLKMVVINSVKLKKVGKKAFFRKGGRKLAIKVPKKKKGVYKKLLKRAKTNKYKVK